VKHPTRWIAIGTASAAAVLVVVFALVVGGEHGSSGGRLLGQPAPAFDLPTLDGSGAASADLAGRTFVVNFWNTWCIPCRREHPALVEFYERHRDDPDFVMVGIVRDDTEKAVREYVAEEGVPWIVALDPGGRAALAFGTTGQPETFVVAADGLVTGVRIGPVTVSGLEQMLADARAGGAG